MQETQVWLQDGKHTLDEEMTFHSSILVWRMSWTEEPGMLQLMGLQASGTT